LNRIRNGGLFVALDPENEALTPYERSAAEADSGNRNAPRHEAGDHMRNMSLGAVEEGRDISQREKIEIL